MSNKTFFGSIDMRNARFQGAIRDSTPDGIGLIFNHQHFLALTTWKSDLPYGPSLLFFPNRDCLYGKIKNKKLQDVCAFHKATGQTYYFNFVNGVADRIAYLQPNGLVTELVSTEGKLKTESISLIKDKANDKWNTISSILGVQVTNSIKTVSNYIRETFQKQFYDIIECIDSSGFTFLGFKNTPSLGFKLDSDDKVRQLGIFQAFPRNLEFGRKYFDSTNRSVKIEEGKFTYPQKIFSYQGNRPTQAFKSTQQFFKRGTNFKNEFFKCSVFDDISNYLRSIQDQLKALSMFQYGQKIIEQPEQKEELYENNKYSFEDIKKQIYAAVERKNKGRRSDKTSSLPLSQQRYERVPMPLSTYRESSNSPNELSPIRRSNPKRYLYTEVVKDEFKGRQPAKISQQFKVNQFTLYQDRQQPSKQIYYPTPLNQALERSPLVNSNRYLMPEENITFKSKTKDFFGGNYPKDPPISSNYKISKQSAIYEPQPRENVVYKANREQLFKEKPVFTESFTLGQPLQIQQQHSQYEHYIKYKNRPHQSPGQSQYQHYIKYKNRNKTPSKESESATPSEVRDMNSMYFPKKYQIYENKRARLKDNSYEKQLKKQIKQDPVDISKPLFQPPIPTRHKKNFKYL